VAAERARPHVHVMTSKMGPMGMPLRHSPALRALGRVALRLAGWRIVGELPSIPKFVIVVAPHTSNWDFPIGVAAMFALDLDVTWLGKDSLFRGPHARVLRWLGGRPVKRDAPEGLVAEVAAAVRDESRFILALAPEGTRRRVDQWKTGFYRIAEAAGVPIVPVWLDWQRHEIGIGHPLMPAGAMEAEVAALQSQYHPQMARHPEKFWAGAT
jgi:1-acyl-sn-glycerol-3-phosphate acyltransferase